MAVLLVTPDVIGDEDARDKSTGRYTVVMLSAEEDNQETQGLVGAIESQLVDLPVDFTVEFTDRIPAELPQQLIAAERVAGLKDASAVFWCDLSEDNRVFLYVAQAGKGRILVRKLDREEGGKFEAVAIIVRSLVQSLSSGGVISVMPPDDSREGNTPEPAATETGPGVPEGGSEAEPEESALRVELGVGYNFLLLEAETAAHGLNTGLSVTLFRGLYAIAAYTLYSEIQAETNSASIELQRHPAAAGFGYLSTTGMLSLGGCILLSIDYAVQTTTVEDTSIISSKSNEDLLLSLVPAAVIGVQFIDRLALRLALGMEVPFNRLRYIFDISGEKKVVLDPWPVQPMAVIGLWVALFDE